MKTLRKPILVMLLFAAVLMAGCKKDENDGNNENTVTVGHKNPNPAQDTPLSEHFLSEFESINQLYPNPDGSFYALADGEYTDYLLKLDNNGYVQQRTELGYRSRRCIVKSGENIVLIGNVGKVSSPYEMFEKGYVAMYDRNMQLTAMTYVTEPQYKIELNTLIRDSHDSDYFFAGGLAIDENYIQYPYFCVLKFSNGMLTKDGSTVLTQYEKQRIVGMVEKNYSGQTDMILETIKYSVLDHPYHKSSCTVHIVKPNLGEEESGWGSETWDVVVTGLHGDSYTGNNSIDSDENNIYFFGYYYDDKSPAPSSGGYWRSGCVAAVNWHNGQLVWTKKMSLTNRDEFFEDGFISDGFLYACGMHSGVHITTTKKQFGNGLVAKYTFSGELVGYKTFGDPERDADFIHLAKDVNGKLVCVGYSGENLGNDNTKWSAWFLKTDMSSNGSSKATPDFGAEVEILNDLDAESTGVPMDGNMRFGGM